MTATETAVRLVERVRREAKRAAKKPDADGVHDLRVAIRRSRQCLAEFKEALPEDTVRKARKKMRKILRKAGPVRNIDVARVLMKSVGARSGRQLSTDLSRERAHLERELLRLVARFNEHDPAKGWVSKLRAKADDGQTPPGIEELPTRAAEYFDEGDRTADPSTPVETLHSFRLKTKKFRYTLELYAGFYGPALKSRLESLRTVQEHLGAISDCFTTLELLSEHRDVDPAAVEKAVQAIRPQIDKHALAFRREWRTLFTSSERRAWLHFLEHERATVTQRRPASNANHPKALAARTA